MKYVIISDADAPQRNMVCQMVPDIGYCYLDRTGVKPRYDGMQGEEATPVEAFGLLPVENDDGTVSFYKTNKPVTAKYRDGRPRRWQGTEQSFEFRQLTVKVIFHDGSDAGSNGVRSRGNSKAHRANRKRDTGMAGHGSLPGRKAARNSDDAKSGGHQIQF